MYKSKQSTSSSQDQRQPASSEIKNALNGSIEPVRKSPLYFAGLFLVTLTMIILPVNLRDKVTTSF